VESVAKGTVKKITARKAGIQGERRCGQCTQGGRMAPLRLGKRSMFGRAGEPISRLRKRVIIKRTYVLWYWRHSDKLNEAHQREGFRTMGTRDSRMRKKKEDKIKVSAIGAQDKSIFSKKSYGRRRGFQKEAKVYTEIATRKEKKGRKGKRV